MTQVSEQLTRSKFYAYLSRLRLIKRWGLMRNSESENVMEHSWDVAVIAHSLAVIRNQYFAGQIDANALAVAALFHDVSEVLTDDMPTPVKYHHASLTQAYRQIEAKARRELTELLPAPLQEAYAPLLQGVASEDGQRLLKAADHLSAYLKCLRELRWGNLEFQGAAQRLEAKLKQCDLPEVAFFLQVFVPDCTLPLDHLLEVDSSTDYQHVFVHG